MKLGVFCALTSWWATKGEALILTGTKTSISIKVELVDAATNKIWQR